MSSGSITIPQEQWGALIGSAIMQAITQENRDILVKAAIQHLLTPQENYGGRRTPPIQDAFNRAMQVHAEKEITAMLADDSATTGILRALVREAVEKATTGDNREKLVKVLADAISKAIKVTDY